MSCYMRHLRSWFDDLDLEYDQPNRKRVDVAVRRALELGADTRCPEVWAVIKAMSAEDRSDLLARVRQLLA